jgi:hypothetical protein
VTEPAAIHLPVARRAVFEALARDDAATWIQATGDSMRPLIRPGTWLFVRFGETPHRLGQIAVFSDADLIVAHRLVAIRDDGDVTFLVTKGDAEPRHDRPIAPSDLLGLVESIRLEHDGPRLTTGCSGTSARAIAAVSHWSARVGIRARRVARTFPDPLRRRGIRVATVFAGSASRAGAAPAAWLAAAQSRRGRR